jgi:hypothetical protein
MHTPTLEQAQQQVDQTTWHRTVNLERDVPAALAFAIENEGKPIDGLRQPSCVAIMAALDRRCPQAYKDAVWKRLQLLRDSVELRGYNHALGNQPKYIIDRVMQLHPKEPT